MFNTRPNHSPHHLKNGTAERTKSAHQQRLHHPDLRHQQSAEDAHERHEHVPRRGGRVRVPRRREPARAEPRPDQRPDQRPETLREPRREDYRSERDYGDRLREWRDRDRGHDDDRDGYGKRRKKGGLLGELFDF